MFEGHTWGIPVDTRHVYNAISIRFLGTIAIISLGKNGGIKGYNKLNADFTQKKKPDPKSYCHHIFLLINRVSFFIWFISLTIINIPSYAQTIIYSDDYNKAFSEMYEDPTDLSRTFAFAEQALIAGDFEGAVSALERMLLVDPKLPKIRLELGKLYIRLGSYAIARIFLEEVIMSGEASNNDQEEAKSLLDETKNAQNIIQFNNSFVWGLRVQSNANSAPKDSRIIIFGIPATLDDEFTSRGDYDAYFTMVSNVNIEDAVWENVNYTGSLILYGNEHLDQTSLNAKLGSANIGFNIEDNIFSIPFTFSPYIDATYLRLSDDELLYNYGGGAKLQININKSISVLGKLDRKLIRFNDLSRTGSETALNGDAVQSGFDIFYQVSPFDNLSCSLLFIDEDTKNRKDSSKTKQFSISYDKDLAGFDVEFLKDISIKIDFGASERDYQATDFLTDASQKRTDINIASGMSVKYQFLENLHFSTLFQMIENRSNINNFDYKNNTATLETVFTF